MSLVVAVKSTEPDWTTTSAVKSRVGVQTTNSDVAIGDLIRRASRWAESYIGQPLGVQTYEETVAGMGRRRLSLSRTPIRAILGVFDATDTGQAADLTTGVRMEDEAAGHLSRDEGFGWTATVMPVQFQSAFPLQLTPMGGEEYKPYLVRYVAGWTRDGVSTSSPNYTTGSLCFGTTSTERTLPEDVEQGVLLKVEDWYEKSGYVQHERLDDQQVTYRTFGPDELPPAESALAPWRRY